MNKNELKKILKPLIKECIKEVIFEDKGTLSHVISEVVSGLGHGDKKVVSEAKTSEQKWIANAKAAADRSKKLEQHKKSLLKAIGEEAYGGVNIFEGTTPAPSPQESTPGPLSGVSPNDAGVDITNIFSGKSSAIFNKMMEKK